MVRMIFNICKALLLRGFPIIIKIFVGDLETGQYCIRLL